MRQLHIRAQSGPRPVTAAAVRAMLADGSVDATSPVLSLDAGRTWQPVQDALAVIDGLAVDDTAVDHALRVGPLHPIAMPLGAVAIVLLTAGIGFSGAPVAQAIRETPGEVAGVLQTTAEAGVTALNDSVCAGGQCLGNVALSFMQSGMARVTMPDVPEQPADTVATATATATGDLLADWRVMLADKERSDDAWETSANSLGKQTIASGVAGWNARMTQLDVITDENRERFTDGVPGAGKALRLAMFDVDAGPGVERIELILLIEDAALAKTCDSLAAAGRDLNISAKITKVSPNAQKHAVLLQGMLTSAE